MGQGGDALAQDAAQQPCRRIRFGVRGGVEVQAAECVLTMVPGAAIMPAAGAWVPAAHA